MKTSSKFLVDRAVAMPLAWAANLAARSVGQVLNRDHSVRPEEVRTIAVAKLLGMGSIIQATPLLHDLRRSFPHAKIVFLTTLANRALIERLDLVDDAVYVDDSTPDVLAWTTARAVTQLLARKIDLYFDLEVYSAGSSILSLLSVARNRVGFYRGSARFKKGIYTHLTVFNPRAPIASIYRQLHLCVGGTAEGPPVYGPIRVSEEDEAGLEKKLEENHFALPQRFVVVNPNASDLLLERRWPMDRYVELIERIVRGGTEVVLIGARSETDYVGVIVAKLAPDVRSHILDTSGKLSLGELFALIKRASVVVTNDTGPMHFSIALSRPTVCLFGPVSPAHYGVHKSNVEMLYHGVYCSPCAHELDLPPCAGNNVCMQLITIPEVMAAVERQLANRPAPVKLPMQDLRFSAPQGGALGVLVRASVEKAGTGGALKDPKEPTSDLRNGEQLAGEHG